MYFVVLFFQFLEIGPIGKSFENGKIQLFAHPAAKNGQVALSNWLKKNNPQFSPLFTLPNPKFQGKKMNFVTYLTKISLIAFKFHEISPNFHQIRSFRPLPRFCPYFHGTLTSSKLTSIFPANQRAEFLPLP